MTHKDQFSKEAPASRSMELPVVVLGSSDAGERPAERLLPGRIEASWVLYPCYLLVIVSGSLVVNFAIDTFEWSPMVVLLAWVLLFTWNWVYGVAYRYRRRIMKYFSVTMSIVMGLGLAALCWERGQPQLVATAADVSAELIERAEVRRLLVACWLMVLSTAALLAHVLFLGRGYRVKRAVSKKNQS